eukprot:gene18090-biopygen9922
MLGRVPGPVGQGSRAWWAGFRACWAGFPCMLDRIPVHVRQGSWALWAGFQSLLGRAGACWAAFQCLLGRVPILLDMIPVPVGHGSHACWTGFMCLFGRVPLPFGQGSKLGTCLHLHVTRTCKPELCLSGFGNGDPSFIHRMYLELPAMNHFYRGQ